MLERTARADVRTRRLSLHTVQRCTEDVPPSDRPTRDDRYDKGADRLHKRRMVSPLFRVDTSGMSSDCAAHRFSQTPPVSMRRESTKYHVKGWGRAEQSNWTRWEIVVWVLRWYIHSTRPWTGTLRRERNRSYLVDFAPAQRSSALRGNESVLECRNLSWPSVGFKS